MKVDEQSTVQVHVGGDDLSARSGRSRDLLTVKGLGVDSHMGELKRRSAIWWKRGKGVAIFSGIAGLAALAAHTAVNVLWPTGVSITDLDVPVQIAKVMPSPASFSYVLQSDGAGLSGAIVKMFGLMGGVGAFGLLSMGCYRWVFEAGDGAKPTVAGLALGAVASVCTLMWNPSDAGDSRQLAQVSWLEASSWATSPAGIYVRAQAALSRDELSAQGKSLVKAAADALQNDSPAFEPSPRIAAIIEKSAYGEERSPIAVQYADTRAARAGLFDGVSTALSVLATIGTAVALTLILLGWLVDRRRRRLSRAIRRLRSELVSLDALE
ncbi:hypothetical protein [Stenotrophomonas muris]|uniref:hypothetical protein n=1 Tax=Stenotrophomonas muris TaxID=2963283 RepID=UPI00383BB850